MEYQYQKLPYQQYFIDQSQGSRGGEPRVKINYQETIYEHGKHTHTIYHAVYWDESRSVLQLYFKETSDKSEWKANFEFASKYYDRFSYDGKMIQLKTAGGWGDMYSCVKQLLVTLWMLIVSSEVGLKDLSGVVGIFSLTSSAAQNGFGYLLYWMGFLSVNVGFMNLLPIPALDGGRLFFLLIEAIRKKPVSQKVQDMSINITMILLYALIAYTIVNDIIRLL